MPLAGLSAGGVQESAGGSRIKMHIRRGANVSFKGKKSSDGVL